MAKRSEARVIRGGTSRGAHIRALWEALSALIDLEPDWPTERRVRLRGARAALERAHRELQVNASDLAQYLAGEDGEGFDEGP